VTAAGALLGAVRFYQRAVSPNLPPRCRFEPSCSAYAAEAISVHGAGRGSWLAVRRLARCAPWHPGGLDLVPPAADADHQVTDHRGTGHGGRSSSTSLPTGDVASTGAAPELDLPPTSGRALQLEAGVV